VYNAIHRTVEQELVPCLRYYGISFYEYNPLAGCYLADKYQHETEQNAIEKGSRYDPSTLQGRLYRERYWNTSMFDTLETLRTAMVEYIITEAVCALRWMAHHSLLRLDKHDAIVIGASSFKQLQKNLLNLEKGPLPGCIVEAFNQGWDTTRVTSWMYWR
jgi:aflatoxin B1 aldehyde reductase